MLEDPAAVSCTTQRVWVGIHFFNPVAKCNWSNGSMHSVDQLRPSAAPGSLFRSDWQASGARRQPPGFSWSSRGALTGLIGSSHLPCW